MSKNTIIVIILIVVLGLGGWFWYNHTKQAATIPSPVTSDNQTSNTPTTPIEVKQTEVPTAQLPQGFPSDIPLEQGATITQNYTAEGNGMSQVSRVWVTAKTLDQNFQAYQSFFSNAKNGWTILNTVNQDNLKVITASKGGITTIVNINKNTITSQQTISITASWSSK